MFKKGIAIGKRKQRKEVQDIEKENNRKGIGEKE